MSGSLSFSKSGVHEVLVVSIDVMARTFLFPAHILDLNVNTYGADTNDDQCFYARASGSNYIVEAEGDAGQNLYVYTR